MEQNSMRERRNVILSIVTWDLQDKIKAEENHQMIRIIRLNYLLRKLIERKNQENKQEIN